MEHSIAELEQVYIEYRQELAEAAKKKKPTDGLFGFGQGIQDDPCHERMDERIAAIIQQAADEGIESPQAAQMIRMLFTQSSQYPYPASAEWMLYATERHAMLLVPLLKREDAMPLCREYEKRYKPWNRLPVQKQLHRALKQQCAGK